MKQKIFAILALPPPPSRREAYEYAERIMARLPHRLRELRLALGLGGGANLFLAFGQRGWANPAHE